jgi:L-cystine uptake protein TcyP (sodium:dicarboxylate symporter family)
MSSQLTGVIEACLSDLELKLKAIALNEGSSESDLEKVRHFINQLADNSVALDIEELLPKILAYVHGAKVS